MGIKGLKLVTDIVHQSTFAGDLWPDGCQDLGRELRGQEEQLRGQLSRGAEDHLQ